MIPLIDMHCHLCAGLDDGPRTAEDALQMCRIAVEDGIRTSVALAHQNEQYPAVTPERIRTVVRALIESLDAAGKEKIPLTVCPMRRGHGSPRDRSRVAKR